ncbi:toxin-antitoxin system, toxin component family protein [Streptomyces sp. NPDC087212]|uniref:toxin-antitoxin system, toxin component family protein n=1 Tax=Streptomyces sp. NPDC087212 TaxID=3365766 RepID=UPI0038004204
MDSAGARSGAARITAGLVRRLRRPARSPAGMRVLTARLRAAVQSAPRPEGGVRELCRLLCEEMSALRGGRPIRLRFERFPDEIEVTGVWVELADLDLVIVEERAEDVQQLVILGHELWHLHAGHRHRDVTAPLAHALADWRRDALGMAARDGSRARDEAEADAFGHRLAAAVRPLLAGAAGAGTAAPLDPLQRSLGYRGRRDHEGPGR